MSTMEQIHALMRETDYCATSPPEYADEILLSRVPSEFAWHVTCRHGQKMNRYVVRQETIITPVENFGKVDD